MQSFSDKLKALGLKNSTEILDPFASLKISHTSTDHSITAKASGPRLLVETWLQYYEGQYPYAGYATVVKKRALRGSTLTLTVWRARSCD